MYVNKITKESFPGISFYTRKKGEGLYLGCYNPAQKNGELQSPQEILRMLDN
jgi:hypothetical protein